VSKVQRGNVVFDSSLLQRADVERLVELREWLTEWAAKRGPAIAHARAFATEDEAQEKVYKLAECQEWYMLQHYVQLIVHEFGQQRERWIKSGAVRAEDIQLAAVFRTLEHVVDDTAKPWDGSDNAT